jgi:release factor glutamine methyltransferase
VIETALPLAQKAAQLFAERGFENARLEAELLLAHVLGIKRLDLYLQFERPLTNAELETFRTLVRRRLKREPLQYIVGTQAFRHLDLLVDPRALIPRPETEVLVGQAIDWAKSEGSVQTALDIGTGTGAIALSLLHEKAATQVVATDVSSEALELARTNAERSGLSNSVEFRLGRTFQPIRDGEQFDIVISNPPYVAEVERDALQPEVRDWEPATALFAGDDGLAIVREIVADAPRYLRAGGLIALEVGMTQAQLVGEEMRRLGVYDRIEVVRDLTGRDRVVTAVRKA